MTILRTERLTLTPMAASDLADLKPLWADPAFTRHIFGQPLTGEEVWFRLLRDIGHWAAVGYGNWAVRLKDGGNYVGSGGVLDYRREMTPTFDAPELGWGVAPRFQGQGLALEAVSAALGWCDEALKAPRTVCIISPGNTASLKLADRAGYRPYGEAVYKGDTVILLQRLAA